MTAPASFTLALLLILAPSLPAQGPSLTPANAEEARAALRRAGAARRAGQLDTAALEAAHAARAWPVQPAYAAVAARAAAEQGDTAALATWLRRLVRLESGGPVVEAGPVTALAARNADVGAALTALRDVLAPRDGSAGVLTLPDTTWFPEGLDADPRTGALYVTSLRHRAIARIDRTGAWAPFLTGDARPPLAPFAVAVDTARNLLYAVTGPTPVTLGVAPADSARGELLRFTLAEGRLTGRWPLGDGRVVPGEMAVLPDGDILVGDALRGTVYRWSPATLAWRTRTDPWLRSPQGIAPTADGQVVYIADWSSGILRWDLTNDRITRVTEPEGTTLVGIDGLRRAGNALVGVQNGVAPARVLRITLDAEGTRATALTTLDRPRYDGEPTVGTMLGRTFIYVASSHWNHYGDDGNRRPGTPALPPIQLRKVPLPD